MKSIESAVCTCRMAHHREWQSTVQWQPVSALKLRQIFRDLYDAILQLFSSVPSEEASPIPAARVPRRRRSVWSWHPVNFALQRPLEDALLAWPQAHLPRRAPHASVLKVERGIVSLDHITRQVRHQVFACKTHCEQRMPGLKHLDTEFNPDEWPYCASQKPP